ncbi:MAG: hypothetical protein JWM22_638 [Frankiales bacterium]|nr:hypothetical protein [Frankiales bacterium]
MTPEECARGIAGAVGRIGGEWMFDPVVHARGTELGFENTWSWYHCGRGGVLGNAPASVVVAAFGFFPPELQTKAWEKGCAVMDPPDTSREYAAACAAWGTRRFASVEAAGRLADLLTRALDSAPTIGLPLFAGWRDVLHRYDTAGPHERLALALQTAREHRGGSHLVAVAGYGVDPLQAVMSGRYGATNAEFFGWPKPWPDPEIGKEQMAAAERVTNHMVSPAFSVLTDDERAELTAGLRAL